MYTRVDLLKYLEDSGVLVSPHIVRAFSLVDRADFVPLRVADYMCYADQPLKIGFGQTISQPTTVAFMLELLGADQGDCVLDVGTGSGWTSALLGHIVGSSGVVYGVEIVPELVVFGRRNIAKYDMENVHIAFAGNVYGDPDHAPFDRILVSAAAQDIPSELIDQLKIGGILVIPVQNDIVRYHKITEGIGKKEVFHGFSFVPLISPDQ